MRVSTSTQPIPSQATGINDKALLQRQKEMIQLQDEMITEIGVGVEKLHHVAVAIGDEARIHTRLLDDLDETVEIATTALQAESKHAEAIKEKSKICYMYICIAVQVIVIVLLLILAFK